MNTAYHPFYCYKKKCRKTAWETPEYLTEYDWILLAKLIVALEANDKKMFDSILYPRYKRKVKEDNDYIFFNRIVGWVEGKVYYRQMFSDNHTYFNGFVKRDLPKLKLAFQNYSKLSKN